MECGQNFSGQYVDICIEVTRDPLICAATAGGLDPCPALLDRESCEAIVSDLGYACRWEARYILDVSTQNCDVVARTESCVLTTLAEPLTEPCVAPGFCAADASSVSFADLGPGTAALHVLEYCGETPVYPPAGITSLCEFSEGGAVPWYCECGCPASQSTTGESADDSSG